MKEKKGQKKGGGRGGRSDPPEVPDPDRSAPMYSDSDEELEDADGEGKEGGDQCALM